MYFTTIIFFDCGIKSFHCWVKDTIGLSANLELVVMSWLVKLGLVVGESEGNDMSLLSKSAVVF